MKRIKDILYVGIQFILFIIYALVPHAISFPFPLWFIYFGLAITLLGLLVISLALLQLNKNLSPFPTPKTNSELVNSGLYRWVRHPIYTGIILLVFGYASYSQNGYRFLISFSLLLLFYLKSLYEESLLKKKFSDYRGYMRTTGRFFPFI
jgi:protein-S-isoprenylcysteine O-methyltransferase Ste14